MGIRNGRLMLLSGPWQSKRNRKANGKNNTRGKRQVLLPYIEKVTEKVSRILAKHGVNTVVKPHCTLRRLLVHPKDKVKTLRKSNCVHRIPCENCDKSYVGETGRSLGLRIEEHRKEAEKSVETLHKIFEVFSSIGDS